MSKENRPLYFRGQADLTWSLRPYVLRDCFKEKTLILDYTQVFALDSEVTDNIERILVEMQHHDIPTRLLDWSLSPLVALFFASSDKPGRSGRIFCMNPWHVYRELRTPTQLPHPTNYFEILKQSRMLLAVGRRFEEIEAYCDKKYGYRITSQELTEPLPIVGRYMDNRVQSQQGCFVVWGTDSLELENSSLYSKNMMSCIVAKKSKENIMKELSRLGINDFTLMRDREGFSKTVKSTGGIFNNFIQFKKQ